MFIDLQKKFQQDENLKNSITIKQIFFKDKEESFKIDKDSNLVIVTKGRNALKDLCKEFDHVMVDEYFADFEHLSKESRTEFGETMANQKTLWMSYEVGSLVFLWLRSPPLPLRTSNLSLQ